MRLNKEEAHAIAGFRNFLSWGALPRTDDDPNPPRNIPPAWWAYAMGATSWCPPPGEM